jgi:O-acetyl-ADP-ribose deacetylase (regulator of RNase III)
LFGGGAMVRIVHASVVVQQVDALVNAANSSLAGGGGVDGALHKAAGPRLDVACKKLHDAGGCPVGEARITSAFDITWARHIIHTVGPIYANHTPQESDELLRKCYINSCEAALQAGDQSIAFPAISCGVYGYPLDRALVVSLSALVPYEQRFQDIVLAMFMQTEFETATAVAKELYPSSWRSDALVVHLSGDRAQ